MSDYEDNPATLFAIKAIRADERRKVVEYIAAQRADHECVCNKCLREELLGEDMWGTDA